MDPSYTAPDMETRTVFGLNLQQKKNNALINVEMMKNIVSQRKEVRKAMH